MTRVLIIMNAADINGGGISNVIINYFEELKKERDLQIDFAMNLAEESNFGRYAADNNSAFYQLPNKNNNLWAYMKTVSRAMKNSYDAVHVHGSSSTMLLELYLAKRAGIKKRIAHSHNSQCTHNFLNKILNPAFRKSYTYALACSLAAGEWIYGAGLFKILPNAVDCGKYRFNPAVRKEYRKLLKADSDVFVVGHAGNFNRQKNHSFLIDIFCEVQKKIKTAILILIGQGELEGQVRQKVKERKIENSVVFLGQRSDVEAWLSAMDVFVLPSLFEGLPLILVEAEAAGLPCVVSDMVTEEAVLSSSVESCGIHWPAVSWAEKISAFHTEREDWLDQRGAGAGQISGSGFDIVENALLLKEIYTKTQLHT